MLVKNVFMLYKPSSYVRKRLHIKVKNDNGSFYDLLRLFELALDDVRQEKCLTRLSKT